MGRMSKRERLQAAIAGEDVDRTPVALWRHWPGDDRTPSGLAEATLQFQYEFDFDLVKVTPASSFCVQDWGSRDEWCGNTEGTRDYTFRPVQRPEDWGKLKVLAPDQGALGEQLQCLEMVRDGLEDVPFIQTIFSPMAQAKNLAGQERMLLHMRRYPDTFQEGLTTILESTLAFIDAARATGIAGIFYAVQHASYRLLSEAEYRQFGLPHDMQILEAVQDMWLNVLHLHGDTVMFDLVAGYPAQVLNWHDRESGPPLGEGLAKFAGAVCGGLARNNTVVRGTREQVRAEAEDALAQVGGKRFVLGTGCVVPIVAPWGNVRAVRDVVES